MLMFLVFRFLSTVENLRRTMVLFRSKKISKWFSLLGGVGRRPDIMMSDLCGVRLSFLHAVAVTLITEFLCV